MNVIQNRSEILFLYDVKQCNPNGDPMDANRPRIDEETGKCLVTDVRLKRTVRDHLMELGYNGQTDKNQDIFIRDKVDGSPQTGEERSRDYNGKDEFTQKFIDVRLFGGVSAPKKVAASNKKEKGKIPTLLDDNEGEDTGEVKTDEKKTFNFTGPVQFGMGKTLHVVKENFIKGTGAFATKEGAGQKTFREEYNISYGMIAFHGVVNENAARHTKMTDADLDLLLRSMWDGTKGLLTRSKKGHSPRLLLHIEYSEKGFFIGELAERLRMETQKAVEALEDVADYVLDVSALNMVLEKYQDKIKACTVVAQDERLQLSAPIFTK
jgi:CRISPR-associated protein Csh2